MWVKEDDFESHDVVRKYWEAQKKGDESEKAKPAKGASRKSRKRK